MAEKIIKELRNLHGLVEHNMATGDKYHERLLALNEPELTERIRESLKSGVESQRVYSKKLMKVQVAFVTSLENNLGASKRQQMEATAGELQQLVRESVKVTMKVYHEVHNLLNELEKSVGNKALITSAIEKFDQDICTVYEDHVASTQNESGNSSGGGSSSSAGEQANAS